jgi:hypothetical protein
MRTTVRIDEELLTQAKEFAARHRRSLNSVVEDALRELLDRHQRQAVRPQVDLMVFVGDGLMPRVELDPAGFVHEALDGQEVGR